MQRWFLTSAFLAIVAGIPIRAGEPKTEPGFTALFNGKDLDGWHIMNKGNFSVRDGVIFLDKGGGWLRSDKEYKDFELRLDVRFLHKNADSGIFLRASQDGKNWPAKYYQVQTMNNASIGNLFVTGFGKVKSKRDNDKAKAALRKDGEWHAFAIAVKGEHCEVQLNGELVTASDGLANQAGFIGLQGEGGQLEFKNIRIRELK